MGKTTSIPVKNKSTGKRRPPMRGRQMDFAPRRRPRPARPPRAQVQPQYPIETAPPVEEVVVTEVVEEVIEDTPTPTMRAYEGPMVEPKDAFAAAEVTEPVVPEQEEFGQTFEVVPPEVEGLPEA